MMSDIAEYTRTCHKFLTLSNQMSRYICKCIRISGPFPSSHIVRKPAFCICENKDADQLRAFVFATRIVQSLYFLNTKFQASSYLLWLYSPVRYTDSTTKFQASSHLLWLYSPVCVGNPEARFSHNEAPLIKAKMRN